MPFQSRMGSPQSQSMESRIFLTSNEPPKNALSKRTSKCMQVHANPPRTPRERGKNFCPRGDSTNSPRPLPGPSRYLGARGATPLWGSRARRGVSSRWVIPCPRSGSSFREDGSGTPTPPLGVSVLSPPSASSSTTTSSSPPTPASLRKRFSSSSTWLLHFEATPGSLYRPGSSLGNVVRARGRGGAWGREGELQVPESYGLPGWALNRRTPGQGGASGRESGLQNQLGFESRLGLEPATQNHLWGRPQPLGTLLLRLPPFPRIQVSLGAESGEELGFLLWEVFTSCYPPFPRFESRAKNFRNPGHKNASVCGQGLKARGCLYLICSALFGFAQKTKSGSSASGDTGKWLENTFLNPNCLCVSSPRRR